MPAQVQRLEAQLTECQSQQWEERATADIDIVAPVYADQVGILPLLEKLRDITLGVRYVLVPPCKYLNAVWLQMLQMNVANENGNKASSRHTRKQRVLSCNSHNTNSTHW